MVDFLFKNGIEIILIISIIMYIFLIIWIKTKKMKFFKIAAFMFFIAVVISGSTYYIAFHSNYQENKYAELYASEMKKEEIIKKLIEIKNSEENKNFLVFKEVVNLYINEENLNENDYYQILKANKDKDFKLKLQYSEQELEDLNMLLKLTEDIK